MVVPICENCRYLLINQGIVLLVLLKEFEIGVSAFTQPKKGLNVMAIRFEHMCLVMKVIRIQKKENYSVCWFNPPCQKQRGDFIKERV